MAGKMSDMAVTFGLLFLIQKIDFKNEQNILYAQIAFGVVQALILVIYGVVYQSVSKSNNRSVVRVPKTQPSMFSAPDPDAPTDEMTASEYDQSQLKKLFTQSLFSIGITVFLFFKMGIIQPMVMQSVLGPQNLYKNKLFKIYILGQDETQFPRPWVEESPFSAFTGAQNDTPAATTEQSSNGDVTIEDKKVKKIENSSKSASSSKSKSTTAKRATVAETKPTVSSSSSESESEEEVDTKKKKKYL
ncbi:hypothetical protein CYY_005954 [Polysphondylium violaceum]|uniref:Inorganic phosphate transporter n=1 Tax=Polysphondylium violaceum TaxID=133409 RepID=A0A8J4PR81_9MYCE|nr:hypothetical protein CYY_005954 [Polysphondylium violaceum]